MAPYGTLLRGIQIDYLKWLATTTHGYGMSVGMKNTLMLIQDVVDYYDFAVNEMCQFYKECWYVDPFIKQGKAVFATAVTGTPSTICNQGRKNGFSYIYDLDNTGWKSC